MINFYNKFGLNFWLDNKFKNYIVKLILKIALKHFLMSVKLVKFVTHTVKRHVNLEKIL